MVYHVMKDGSIKTDISGHVIKMSDAPTFYKILHNLNKKKARKVKAV